MRGVHVEDIPSLASCFPHTAQPVTHMLKHICFLSLFLALSLLLTLSLSLSLSLFLSLSLSLSLSSPLLPPFPLSSSVFLLSSLLFCSFSPHHLFAFPSLA